MLLINSFQYRSAFQPRCQNWFCPSSLPLSAKKGTFSSCDLDLWPTNSKQVGPIWTGMPFCSKLIIGRYTHSQLTALVHIHNVVGKYDQINVMATYETVLVHLHGAFCIKHQNINTLITHASGLQAHYRHGLHTPTADQCCQQKLLQIKSTAMASNAIIPLPFVTKNWLPPRQQS